MKLVIMQSSPFPRHYLPLSPNILIILFSNIHNLLSSFNMRDQVSHPYRTTSKVTDQTQKVNSFLY